MNKPILLIASIVITSFALVVQANNMTMDEVLVKFTNFYTREMKTEDGRQRFHGKAVVTTDPKNGISIETFEDGFIFTNNLMKSAQQKVDDANSRLKTFVDAKGFPSKLKQAREKNVFAKTNTVEVTVELTAGK